MPALRGLPGVLAAAVPVLTVGGLALGCAEPPVRSNAIMATATADARSPASYGPAVERDVERVRAATARFRDLGEAVAAGYPGTVAHCLDNPPVGGMGYHHIHPDLMDDSVDLEQPEILVYERTPDGDYELVGVEYAVPLDAWTGDEPPTVMGQPLKPAPQLGIWYLHVWVWRTNPHGLFADWNPNVECRE